jgi:hypothetical protein
VDIDETLVQQAWNHLKYRWSLIKPKETTKETLTTEEDGLFPMSMPALFGLVPLPSRRHHEDHQFPLNVSFYQSNWLRSPPQPNSYDVILA